MVSMGICNDEWVLVGVEGWIYIWRAGRWMCCLLGEIIERMMHDIDLKYNDRKHSRDARGI